MNSFSQPTTNGCCPRGVEASDIIRQDDNRQELVSSCILCKKIDIYDFSNSVVQTENKDSQIAIKQITRKQFRICQIIQHEVLEDVIKLVKLTRKYTGKEDIDSLSKSLDQLSITLNFNVVNKLKGMVNNEADTDNKCMNDNIKTKDSITKEKKKTIKTLKKIMKKYDEMKVHCHKFKVSAAEELLVKRIESILFIDSETEF
jgi:hypothetical protein